MDECYSASIGLSDKKSICVLYEASSSLVFEPSLYSSLQKQTAEATNGNEAYVPVAEK